jgi:hypothetical protein
MQSWRKFIEVSKQLNASIFMDEYLTVEESSQKSAAS